MNDWVIFINIAIFMAEHCKHTLTQAVLSKQQASVMWGRCYGSTSRCNFTVWNTLLEFEDTDIIMQINYIRCK